jgi:hypothetical protein
MAKKYIGLEDAAEFVGVLPDELVRYREKGEIRGFSDRDTWKFKRDDLQELRRRLQADSGPDVPILADDQTEESTGGSSVLGSEDDAVGEQSTTIRSDAGDVDEVSEGTSDSDVRLILDESLSDDDSDPDVTLPEVPDSDSDVQLYDDSSTTLNDGSDSDVALVAADSDSDVQLTGETANEAGSDSDVQLVDDSDTVELSSDSDVKLVGGSGRSVTAGDSEVAATTGGSSVVLEDEEGSSVLSDDSGISLSAESGISLESLDDSGISLASDDSGLSILDADSGLTLETDDSGISLEADSGITLDEAGTEEMDQTVPMLGSPSLGDDADDDTELEIPSLEAEDDSEFELQLDDTELDSSSSSSVLLFEDDEDPDEHSATVVKKAGGGGLLNEAEGETFDLTEGDSDAFDLEEDEFAADEDDFDVADDILGEDDELDELDVFDADDDVFDESLETGESHAEFVTPRGVGRVEAAVEADWGGLTFTGLLVSTGLMALCTMLMFDLVRSMWAWNEPSTFSSGLLKALSGLFG